VHLINVKPKLKQRDFGCLFIVVYLSCQIILSKDFNKNCCQTYLDMSTLTPWE